MKIVVTGASGFIGSALVDALVGRGIAIQLVAIDLIRRDDAWWSEPNHDARIREICADLAASDSSSWFAEVADADIIVHLAAMSSVDASVIAPDKTIMNNIAATTRLLQACSSNQNCHLLHLSTDEVYGEVVPPECATEDSPLAPSNPYAASKAASELLCRAYAHTRGVEQACIRLGNTYGPRQHPEKFIPRIVAHALNGRSAPIYGDGKQRRCWLYVSDAIDAICALIVNFVPGKIYNVGTERATTNIELAGHVLSELGGTTAARLRHVADRHGHDRAYSMDSQAFLAAHGWTPSVSLEEGLSKTIAWYLGRQSELLREHQRYERLGVGTV